MSTTSSQSTESSSEEASSVSSVNTGSLAWKIFNAFIERTEICATEEELCEYAQKELNVNISELPSIYVEHFPLILVAFMNNWSGWIYIQEFLAGRIEKEHYFNRFQKYLSHKMKVLGHTSAATKTLKSLKLGDSADPKHKSSMKSTGNLTTSVGCKRNPDFSQFAISIQCPAHMLNSIVFANVGDDVIMKQHLGGEWVNLSTAQLLNWPNIEVTFASADLCFVRRQATDYVRYLNFLPHECKKTNESIVEQLEAINKETHLVKCYTYRFLEEYVKEYVSALKTIGNITGEKLEEIHTVLSQFLEDVRHININSSMATNTLVLFRLAPAPFIRNKKLIKHGEGEDDARVGYCEIITPKVELVMLYFKPQQRDTPHISFESTENIKKMPHSNNLESVLPKIVYKCTFCRDYNKEDAKASGAANDPVNVTVDAKAQMIEHLKKEHKMEQNVRCTVCKKQFDVLNLAACRWRHKCKPTSSTVTVL